MHVRASVMSLLLACHVLNKVFVSVPLTDSELNTPAGTREDIEVKVVRTQALDTDSGLYQSLMSERGLPVPRESPDSLKGDGLPVLWAPDTGDMLVPCQGGASVLRVSMVQPPTKKAIKACDFRNGLRWKEVWTA